MRRSEIAAIAAVVFVVASAVPFFLFFIWAWFLGVSNDWPLATDAIRLYSEGDSFFAEYFPKLSPLAAALVASLSWSKSNKLLWRDNRLVLISLIFIVVICLIILPLTNLTMNSRVEIRYGVERLISDQFFNDKIGTQYKAGFYSLLSLLFTSAFAAVGAFFAPFLRGRDE